MSEIPLAPSEEYKAPSSSGGCNKMLAIVVIAVVVVGSLVAVSFMSGSFVPTTRVVSSWTSENVLPWTEVFYTSEFSVTSAEAAENTPYLRIEASVDNGDDSGAVTIFYELYECSKATVDGRASWSDIETYHIEGGYSTGVLSENIQLENYPQTYTWVLYFSYTGTKADDWLCDLTVTLENIN